MITAEVAQAVSAAFGLFAAHFPEREFVRVYGAGQLLENHKRNWARALSRRRIGRQQIAYAARRAIEECTFAPQLPEFLPLCVIRPADLGLPELEEAYRQAARMAGDLHYGAPIRSGHQAVFHAMQATGSSSFFELSDARCRQLFERNWQIVVQMVLHGEPLREIPKALPSHVFQPPRPGLVQAELRKMRAVLGGAHG